MLRTVGSPCKAADGIGGDPLGQASISCQDWTIAVFDPIITSVTQSVEQLVKQFRKAALKVRRANRDPAKARAFLIRAGIAEKSKSSPNGIRLAKRFRQS